MRGAGAARAGVDLARGGDPARRRLRSRHRQVRAGRLDHPVGDVDRRGYARRGHRQHRGAAPHQDLARARQVAPAWRSTGDWFSFTATALFSSWPGRSRAWRVDAITWSENNTEAIAGLHNKGRRAFAIFDEASAIPDAIWETIEGALTDERHRALLDRVRQSDARQRALSRMLRRRPLRPSLASAPDRFALGVDDQQDADRHLGEGLRRGLAISCACACAAMFPRAGSLQFIDSERVGEAISRPLSAIRRPAAGHGRRHRPARRGPDRHPLPPRARCALDPGAEVPHPRPHAGGEPRLEQINIHKSRCACSSTAPASARASSTGSPRSAAPTSIGVNFGGQRERTDGGEAAARYANKRAEMWGFMKDWLRSGCLPDDATCRPIWATSNTATTAPTRSCWRARTTCAAAGSPRPTTATRWRSPSPCRWPGRTGARNAASTRAWRG